MDDTKHRIINTARNLIMQHGWENVTFRMITSEANVNIAAINYHFGNKEKLENAIFDSITEPMSERTSKQVEEFYSYADQNTPQIEEVIRMILQPTIEYNYKFPNQHRFVQRFFSGIKDPKKIKDHMSRLLKSLIEQYSTMIGSILPNVPKEKIIISCTMMVITSMVFFNKEIIEDMTEEYNTNILKEEVLNNMTTFYAAGFKSL